MTELSETSETSEKEYKYKIILTKPDNVIASDIYSKIKYYYCNIKCNAIYRRKW